MTRRPPVFVVAATIAVAGLLAGAGTSAPPASRIVDRTLACTTEIHAGIRLLTVSAQSSAEGMVDPYNGLKVLPNASLHTGGPVLSDSRGPLISAGEKLVEMTAGGRRETTLSITLTQCRATKAQVALTPARLPNGGPASPFADTMQCFPQRTLLVRVRAEFRSPVVPKRRSGVLTTSAALRKSSFAARTESGRPLLFAEVLESGKARLFTAGSCVPE